MNLLTLIASSPSSTANLSRAYSSLSTNSYSNTSPCIVIKSISELMSFILMHFFLSISFFFLNNDFFPLASALGSLFLFSSLTILKFSLICSALLFNWSINSSLFTIISLHLVFIALFSKLEHKYLINSKYGFALKLSSKSWLSNVNVYRSSSSSQSNELSSISVNSLLIDSKYSLHFVYATALIFTSDKENFKKVDLITSSTFWLRLWSFKL